MLNRSLSVIALAAITAFGASCHSGASGSGGSTNCTQNSGTTFCLVSCSLGCSVGGCTVTDIAANQPLKLTFSQDVDPKLVDFNTISIKTAAGRAPEGRFVVKGKVVEFIPGVKVTGGVTTFGFATGETYVLTVADATQSGLVLKSSTGDALSQSLSCSLRVSRGIVDLDQAPPRANLISPTTVTNVKADAVIILEFSEIIDIAPFKGSTTQTSPVEYLIRKTRQKPGGSPGERVCDPNFPPQVLEGLPQAENIAGRNITIVTLRPSVPLPSQICVEVVVTDKITDLSGKRAIKQVFSFTTEILLSGEGEVKETFAGDSQLDKSVSSGVWGGGKAQPPLIGGTGELGEFNVAMGKADPSDPTHFTFNTDTMVIDKKYTPSGQDITVTGGLFQFTRFVLPEGFLISFVGSNPAQIRVRGECAINGTIEANSPDVGYFLANNGSSVTVKGQNGALGGCGGAAGGQGGDSCPNTGPGTAYDGRNGQDVGLPNGHGYTAQAAGSGGKGSLHWPRSGKLNGTTDYCALNGTFASHTAAGGGGGGFHALGGIGGVTFTPCNGPGQAGNGTGTEGGRFDLGSFAPKTSGKDSSLNHYTVGGSGGGGGGSHPLLSRKAPFDKWLPGTAGAGGGGVVAVRVGGDLSMGSKGVVRVQGGEGYFINSLNNQPGESGDNLFNMPSPGGGGSGGSILFQVFGRTIMNGLLDTSGGKGGVMDNSFAGQPGLKAICNGGTGSPGYYRLETARGASVVDVGTGIPTAASKNVGTLTDNESGGVSQSLFYATRLTFPPTFLRYELEVFVDTGSGFVRKLYSDDVDVGDSSKPQYDPDYAGPAAMTEPVYFRLQGAKVSAVTGQPDLVTLGPWREAAASKTTQSLNDDGATGFRYNVTYDTNSGATKIEIRRVSVFFIE